MLSAFNSQKFKFWSFVSMVLLVFVHGYNIDIRYMSPVTILNEPLTWTSFTEFFFANGIFRFRIPMLFAISGYLYALYDNKPNGPRIKKRAMTLLVPYLLISAITMLAFYLLELYSPARAAIAASHVAQIDREGLRLTVHDYYWYEVILRGLLAPLPYQLWFIRVLFFYCVIYSFIKNWVTGARSQKIFFTVAALLWITNFPPILFDGEGLLFFGLGVWMQKSQFNLDQPGAKLSPYGWGLACVGVTLVKTWLAFQGEHSLGWATPMVLLLLHKFVVASGIIAAWYGSNKLVAWCMAKPWFVWASGFSFIIYAVHAPLVAVAIDPFYSLLNHVYGYRMLTFVLLPLSIVAGAIILGAALRRLLPRAYATLTGGRGLA